jgi:hypothetical protein
MTVHQMGMTFRSPIRKWTGNLGWIGFFPFDVVGNDVEDVSYKGKTIMTWIIEKIDMSMNWLQ